MAANVLIDANILVDFLSRRDTAVNLTATNNLMKRISDKSINGFISPQIIHIVSYLMQKNYSASVDDIRFFWDELLSFVYLIECNENAIDDVILSDMVDFEDCMLAYTAVHNGMDYLATNDKNFLKQQIPQLQIVTPSALLKQLP
ncbi:type II toxin-antitoxin system VapC family toxin [Pinibacter soli]|uniref:Type II toxin-antitoxin system VapC family toxin n=1 Tax=Pinibacter soli TaxID=3044211 RepID=A0ABT6RC18_9BACT|nr:type II toxin-antitoxin system VapC family toxin [Pinibacter soli]MDI3320109.1 type II toxin-antitoxin system VapC family toxin [Pinibacter soli]